MKIDERLITEKILDILRERGASKSWLIKKIDMSEPTFYSRVSNNDFSISEINKICDVLNVSAHEIIGAEIINSTK